MKSPFHLGPMPTGRAMETVDERLVRAPADAIFTVARAVEAWPVHLGHYRWVHILEPANDGGGVVEMAAWRPFGPVGWPTWWRSEMTVDVLRPAIRFRHTAGITRGMDVEWSFERRGECTRVRIVHAWEGPEWPFIGRLAATFLIGPVFIHGIAWRTLAGLARVAERRAGGISGEPA